MNSTNKKKILCFRFLNYLGTEIASTLPNLQFRQAIAVGKAFKSNVPMIFEVPEIDEAKFTKEALDEQATHTPQ